MILSGMACFAGIMAGILSFAHFSAFERFSRSFAAGIMFFISSESQTQAQWVVECVYHILSITKNCSQSQKIDGTTFPLSIFNPSRFSLPALFVLLAMSIYTGVTLSFLGKRFGDWRFSWSYILGWVSMLMTFFAGDRKPHRRLFTVLCIFVTLEPPSVKWVEYTVIITVNSCTHIVATVKQSAFFGGISYPLSELMYSQNRLL